MALSSPLSTSIIYDVQHQHFAQLWPPAAHASLSDWDQCRGGLLPVLRPLLGDKIGGLASPHLTCST